MAAEEVVAALASQVHSDEVSFRRMISELAGVRVEMGKAAAAALWQMVLSAVTCQDCPGAY